MRNLTDTFSSDAFHSYLHPLKLCCISALHSWSRDIKDFPPSPRALGADLLMLWNPVWSKVPAAYGTLGKPCFWGKLWLFIACWRLFQRLASGKLWLFRGRLCEILLRTKRVFPADAHIFALSPVAKVVARRCSGKFWFLPCKWVRGRLCWRLEPLKTLGGVFI